MHAYELFFSNYCAITKSNLKNLIELKIEVKKKILLCCVFTGLIKSYGIPF